MNSKVKKFAIIGTSSAGKTTLVYDILHRLKLAGIHADGVLQQDRRFSFERARLEDSIEAQYSFIANQIKTECDMVLRPGLEVLVSDRSPLDFYAYYEWQYGRCNQLLDFIFHYCKTTFQKLYYVPPLPYVDDGARLHEEGRDKVDSVLLDIIYTYNAEISNDDVNIQIIKREEIYNDIFRNIDKLLQLKDLEIIPKIINRSVLIGGSYAFNRATKYSDIDVYILGKENIPSNGSSMKKHSFMIKEVLGVEVEIRQVIQPVWDYLLKEGFLKFEV